MRLKNSLSPYPILDNYNDDYINSSFTVEYKIETIFTEIQGLVKFHLKNDEIIDLILKGKAEYVVHLECPSTCYRKKISSPEKEIEFSIKSSKIENVIEIRTFIVSTQDIQGFESKDFHPDYEGQKFNLSAHQIIAIGTAKDFTLVKDDRDLESLPSVIQITKMISKQKGNLSVNTDDDRRILVSLTEEVYELYARLGKTIYKSTAFSLVLLPALLIVIQRMYENKDDEYYKSKHWFKVINTILEKNNFKLEDISVENESLLTVCQLIFDNPIERSFNELDILSERE